MQQAQVLQSAKTNSEFANLQEAIGTNDIQNYFPFLDAKNELYPTTFILNQMQRDASGKIKLGLDLQGGTSFLVEMDTNYLASAQDENDTNHVARAPDVSGALSQAVEVLRKRIDQFGVAEPVIQSAGRQSHFDPTARLVAVRQGKRQVANSKSRVSGISDGEG